MRLAEITHLDRAQDQKGLANPYDSACTQKITLKDIHNLKLKKRRREAEMNQKLPFLRHMYGDHPREEPRSDTKRLKQKSKEHVRKMALRAIKNSQKQKQKMQDDAVKYIEKQERERAQRIKQLTKKFDQIKSDKI